jgi:hypothetical protein
MKGEEMHDCNYGPGIPAYERNAFCPVRQNKQGGEFLSMNEASFSMTLVRETVANTAARFPSWNNNNPVVRIVPIRILVLNNNPHKNSLHLLQNLSTPDSLLPLNTIPLA